MINFFSNIINICVIVTFWSRLLTLGILFSTVVGGTKLVILGISVLNSFILALKEVLVTKLLISSVISRIFLIWALYTSFSTTFFY